MVLVQTDGIRTDSDVLSMRILLPRGYSLTTNESFNPVVIYIQINRRMAVCCAVVIEHVHQVSKLPYLLV